MRRGVHRGVSPGNAPGSGHGTPLASSTGDRRHGERGAAAVIVALVLLVLCGFLGLALDVGHLFSVRGELQNAVDSAALAGAKDLDGTDARLPTAINSANQYAALHYTDSSVQVAATAVELGHWTPPAQACSTWSGMATGNTGPNGFQFCRIDARDPVTALNINAVRVLAQRADGAPGGGGAPVFLSGVLGSAPTATVPAEAVAVSGGPCNSNCPNAPLTIRSACLTGPTGLRCGTHYTLGLSPAPADTAGWTDFSTRNGNISTQDICDFFRNGSTCASRLTSGTPIQTGNGNNFSAQCHIGGTSLTICELFKQYTGTTMQIPVVNYFDGNDCSGGYQGTGTIVGFATFQVNGVYCKTDGSEIRTGVCASYATSQCIDVEFVCGQTDPDPAPPGCSWFGLSPLRPMLVR